MKPSAPRGKAIVTAPTNTEGDIGPQMTDRVQNAAGNGAAADIDAVETAEWIEAVDAVVAHDGPDRVRELLTRAVERAQHRGSGPIATLNTPYVNTIAPSREAKLPGDPAVERRLRSIMRWNAMAMVVRANKVSSELGGHIASYQSLAALYEVGSGTVGARWLGLGSLSHVWL